MARKAAAEQNPVVAAVEKSAPARRISTKEAAVLARLGMSGALDNDKARRLMIVYLESLLTQPEVGDDDARAALDILAQAATSNQRKLANDVLSKYLSKFNALIPAVKPDVKPAKEPVAA